MLQLNFCVEVEPVDPDDAPVPLVPLVPPEPDVPPVDDEELVLSSEHATRIATPATATNEVRVMKRFLVVYWRSSIARAYAHSRSRGSEIDGASGGIEIDIAIERVAELLERAPKLLHARGLRDEHDDLHRE